ncbi:TetR/AcrR family transcriptional regulator [Floricoccus penangensis]|uniref:TetR/AcrR family transcriptional regulator n=1 Tax=Floricoccus penangensis TaxID=1859475 RepID=UPI00203FFE80|nr:TetR/AcrR family transcriptional regulator [Floricoccus penangensis]URZ87891.1 TetR/AcrR family transcriptional regulator [Floricoccus penangensis]
MENIKEKILNSAIEKFKVNGYKQTNIQQICKDADIATGSFYKYYSSKEEIYFDSYKKENEKVKEKILSAINFDETPIELISSIISKIFEETSKNKLLNEWSTSKYLREKLQSKSDLIIEESVVFKTFKELIDYWDEKRLLNENVGKEEAIEMFNAISILDLHQNEIQTSNYQKLLKNMFTALLSLILK